MLTANSRTEGRPGSEGGRGKKSARGSFHGARGGQDPVPKAERIKGSGPEAGDHDEL